MKPGDLVRAHNKAQTIGVVICVEASRIQVLAEWEMYWWWEHNATIISEAVSERRCKIHKN